MAREEKNKKRGRERQRPPESLRSSGRKMTVKK